MSITIGSLVVCVDDSTDDYATADGRHPLRRGSVYRVARVFQAANKLDGLGLEEIPESLGFPEDNEPGFAVSRFAQVRLQNTAWLRAMLRVPTKAAEVLSHFDMMSSRDRRAVILQHAGERVVEPNRAAATPPARLKGPLAAWKRLMDGEAQ